MRQLPGKKTIALLLSLILLLSLCGCAGKKDAKKAETVTVPQETAAAEAAQSVGPKMPFDQ